MKKFLVFTLALLLLVCLVSCDNATETNNNLNEPSVTEDSVKLNKFEQFEKGLTDNNIQYEVNQKVATMVGASEGYGYTFSDGTSVEIYLFDTSTEAYKAAFSSNKLNLESFGISMDVIFNGDICIYFNGESTNKAVITNVFNAIK